MQGPFAKDQLDILARRLERGEISRRRFGQLALGLVGAGALGGLARPVMADNGQLVLVNWGGDAGPAYSTAFGEPFQAATGIQVLMDGSGPTEGAIRAQAESGSPSWDIVDVEPFSANTLGAEGLMVPIDYGVVDRAKMREGFGWDFAASAYFYSYVIAYDATRFGDNPPTSMADFFDVERFPGMRAMYKWGAGMWEAALLGDGVAPADLYPLDLDRAHAKIDAFKDHVISFWAGGAESQSLMLNGDASMALVWSTRASLIEQDSEGDVSFTWDQGMIAPGAFGVVSGGPGGAANAMNFLASAQDPERQAVMFEMLGQGPANPAADALIPADRARYNPVDPANFARQIPMNVDWYQENYGPALDTYLSIVTA